MSTASNQSISPSASSDGNSDLSSESASDLRRDIAQTRSSMRSTLSEIEYKLSPQHLAAQATDALAANAQQLAGDTAQRAKVLAADAQAQANTLALAARDQAEHSRQQLSRWLDDISAKYPWFPAALLGFALAIGAFALWRLNARNDQRTSSRL